jgi:DNA-directed RNA polymerase specialized sigma subunit
LRLTEEQSLTVEQNHKLIYWYAKLKSLNLEEWYDLLAIELCNTVMAYNSDRGSISTYYKIRCDRLVYHEYRKKHQQKSFYIPIDIEECSMIDDTRHDIDGDIDVMKKFESKDGEILKLKALGFTQMEICKLLNISRWKVLRVIKKFKVEYERTHR